MPQTQSPALRYSGDGEIDYTPAAAVYAGDVVLVGKHVLVAPRDIAANAKGALANEGLWKVPKITGAISAGDPVYWNPAGDPDNGTAGTGAATKTPAAGAYFMGHAVIDAASGDDYVILELAGVERQPFAPSASYAAAGSVQGDAVAITAAGPIVTALVTGADATKGAKLPTAVAGMIVCLKNDDAANAILKVYPATGAAVNAIAANGAISMAAKTSAVFFATSATQWFTIPLLPS
jgi:predicted RecA/RadA family phage recombinase